MLPRHSDRLATLIGAALIAMSLLTVLLSDVQSADTSPEGQAGSDTQRFERLAPVWTPGTGPYEHEGAPR